MREVNTQLESCAREIFQELGYSVSSEGRQLRAERKWRVVRVTPMAEPTEVPRDGKFHCFVTSDEQTGKVERRLRSRDLPYEWAVIGVGDRGEYEVTKATTKPQ